MNFLPENSIWGTFTKFHGKNVLCEKGDEITRFDVKGYKRAVPNFPRFFLQNWVFSIYREE